MRLAVALLLLFASSAAAQPITPSPAHVEFTWVVGQPLPVAQTVSVGAGTQSWTTQDNNPWADTTGGSWASGVSTYPPTSPSFGVQPSSGMQQLTPGTYTEQITVKRGTSSVLVPVKATVMATGPPGPSSTRTISYTEPTLSVDGSPLADLGSVRLYYSLNGAPLNVVVFQPSGPTGGASVTQTFSVAATQGTLTGSVASVDTEGIESVRVAFPTMTFGQTSQVPNTPTVKPAVQLRYQ